MDRQKNTKGGMAKIRRSAYESMYGSTKEILRLEDEKKGGMAKIRRAAYESIHGSTKKY